MVVINACLVIDYLADKPIMRIDDMGTFTIKSIEQKTDELYILVFYFSRGQFDVECRIHLLSEDCMWIEPTTNATLFATGESNKYYRLSKPPRVSAKPI
ncbi:hypothetical protein AGMMS49942_29650 [Spirochaetia bacterium]|nr:hypothetical protein AGMMS49942_29650 [Spirochaetia bacterium]